MPRKKRAGTRQSRTMGLEAGTTVGTHPSGVTLTEAGLAYNGTTAISATEVGYLDGAGGSVLGTTPVGSRLSGGSMYWAGASVAIATGLTTVAAFVATNIPVASATAVLGVEWVQNPTFATGGVSAALYENLYTDGTKTLKSLGVTMTWMAFGT
jgi:hypothetical protein